MSLVTSQATIVRPTEKRNVPGLDILPALITKSFGSEPAILGLLALYAFMFMVLSPLGEYLSGDDTPIYALIVRRLATTGELDLLGMPNSSVLFHLWWGTAFVKLFGFSFTTLRVSMFILSFIGVVTLYLLLKELGFSRLHSLLGSLVLALNPIYFWLSYTFMTDITFLTMSLIALLFYTRGFKSNSNWQLVVASTFASFAILTRQIAVALLAACFVYILVNFRHDWRTGLRRALLSLFIPVAVFVAYYLWFQSIGTTTFYQDNVRNTIELWSHPFTFQFVQIMYRRAFDFLIYVGFFALPVIGGYSIAKVFKKNIGPTRSRAWLIGLSWLFLLFAGLAIGIWRDHGYLPGIRSNIIHLRGFLPTLYGDLAKAVIMPQWTWIIVTALSVISAAFLCAFATNKILRNGRNPAGLSIGSRGLLYLSGLFLLILTAAWNPNSERYLVVAVPFVAIAALDASRKLDLSTWRVVAGLAILGAFSFFNQQDYLAWVNTRTNLGLELVANSIPAKKIDGGTEWNHWYRWEDAYLARKRQGIEIDAEYQCAAQYDNDKSAEYKITFSPLPGYTVVKETAYAPPWMGQARRLFILNRSPGTEKIGIASSKCLQPLDWQLQNLVR